MEVRPDWREPETTLEQVTPEMISAVNRRNSLISWAKTLDRRARTRPGKEAAEERYYRLAREAGHITPEAIEQAAQKFRQAHYANMAIKSVASRRAKAAARRGAGE